VKHLSSDALLGKLLAIPANIRSGWKSLLGANTLAYYEQSSITALKSFLTLGPGGLREAVDTNCKTAGVA
jgi:hypothetical protein